MNPPVPVSAPVYLGYVVVAVGVVVFVVFVVLIWPCDILREGCFDIYLLTYMSLEEVS